MSLRSLLWRQDLLFALLLLASAIGHWGLGYVGGATLVRPVPLERQQGRTTVAIELVARAEPAIEEFLPPLPDWQNEEVMLDSSALEIPLVSAQSILTSKRMLNRTQPVAQRNKVESIPQPGAALDSPTHRLRRSQQQSPQLESHPDRLLQPAPQKLRQRTLQLPVEKVPAEARQTVLRKGSTGVPVPPQIRSRPDPVHPRELLRRKIEGSVKLTVRVGANGKVTAVGIRQSSGYAAMDQAAVAAVRRWEFAPGRRQGQPVAMTVIVPVEFRISRR